MAADLPIEVIPVGCASLVFREGKWVPTRPQEPGSVQGHWGCAVPNFPMALD